MGGTLIVTAEYSVGNQQEEMQLFKPTAFNLTMEFPAYIFLHIK